MQADRPWRPAAAPALGRPGGKTEAIAAPFAVLILATADGLHFSSGTAAAVLCPPSSVLAAAAALAVGRPVAPGQLQVLPADLAPAVGCCLAAVPSRLTPRVGARSSRRPCRLRLSHGSSRALALSLALGRCSAQPPPPAPLATARLSQPRQHRRPSVPAASRRGPDIPPASTSPRAPAGPALPVSLPEPRSRVVSPSTAVCPTLEPDQLDASRYSAQEAA